MAVKKTARPRYMKKLGCAQKCSHVKLQIDIRKSPAQKSMKRQKTTRYKGSEETTAERAKTTVEPVNIEMQGG